MLVAREHTLSDLGLLYEHLPLLDLKPPSVHYVILVGA